MMDKELLSVDDLCDYLGLSRSTVRKMEKSGKLPGHVTLNLRRFYRRSVIDRWLGGTANV